MALARISVEQALAVSVLGIFSLFLAWNLIRARTKLPSLAVYSSLACLFISLWLFDNVLTDRTSIPELSLFLARISWVLPYFVLLALLLFFLHFPPKAGRKLITYTLIFSLAILLTGSIISLHPAGFVVYFDHSLGYIKTSSNLTSYYAVMGSYLVLFLLVIATLAAKWRKLKYNDKKVTRIVMGSFLQTLLLTITFSILEALNDTNNYYYVYSSLSTVLFSVGLTYAILKHGAYGQWFTLSISTITTVALATTSGISLWLMSILSDYEKLPVILPASVAVGVSILVYQSLIHVLAKRRKSFLSQSINIGNDPLSQTFVKALCREFSLSKCAWRPAKNATTDSSYLKLNTVDVPANIVKRMLAQPFHETGPDRTAVIIETSQGTLRAGRKKFHVSFTEKELRSMRHEVALHAAQLELDKIRNARRNHLSELEYLTEKRRARLLAANQTFLEKLQKRAKFFTLVAQELRTPLNLVANAVHQGSIQVTPTVGKTLTDNTDRLLDLTTEIQELSSRNLDTPLVDWLKIDVACQEMQMRYEVPCREKNLKLQFIAHPAHARIAMKQVHFEQILDNLISNAIKFAPERTTITTSLRITPGRALISVADEGPGIPADERPLIFEPFYRSATSRNIKGTGLGLSVVKRLATMYQGHASVYDRTPHGAVFEVDLSVRTDFSVTANEP